MYEHLGINLCVYGNAMDAMEKQEMECVDFGCDENHKCSLSNE